MEAAIKALFRVNYYNEIIHLFRVVIAKRVRLHQGFDPQAEFTFTTRSIELIFESILRKRQYALLDTVWFICDSITQRNWGVISTRFSFPSCEVCIVTDCYRTIATQMPVRSLTNSTDELIPFLLPTPIFWKVSTRVTTTRSVSASSRASSPWTPLWSSSRAPPPYSPS